MSLPSNVTRPLFGASNPVMARSVVDFPAPLAPISVTTSPVLHRQRDVAQRVDGAVEDIHVVEGEHGARYPPPRYASITFGFFWISAGVPMAISSP